MRPFLMLGTRAEDEAAQGEVDVVVALGGLDANELVHHRLERDPLPAGDLRRFLDGFSGVIVGGGPYNTSDSPESKSPAQVRAEADLTRVLDVAVAQDLPFLGLCYGIGILGAHQGGVVDRTYGEAVAAVPVTLTDDGARDPLFSVLPPTFDAFVGHKEALRVPPADAVVLATSAACPVQAFRVGENLYATQFHPELTPEALSLRIEVYQGYGYFAPDEVADLKAAAAAADVTASNALMAAFVQRYRS